MARFTVGQQVRLLHSHETGKIVQRYPDGRLLVSIEDLLEIEVTENEVVATNLEESRQNSNQAAQVSISTLANRSGSVWLVLDQPNATRLDVHLLNAENYLLIFSLSVGSDTEKIRGLVNGQLAQGEQQLLFTTTLNGMAAFTDLHFEWLRFTPAAHLVVPPQVVHFKLKGKHLLKEKEPNPLLKRDAVFIDLTPGEEDLKPEDSLKPNPARAQEKLPDVVDLHIEMLVEYPARLSNSDMLKVQLEHFEQALSKAVVAHVPYITFIHGVGKGRLREEIEKRLADNPFVKEFMLDSSGKYGFGATRVKL